MRLLIDAALSPLVARELQRSGHDSLRRQAKPSFILLRRDIERNPRVQVEVLTRELPRLQEALDAGAIIVITADRIRIRRLSGPIP